MPLTPFVLTSRHISSQHLQPNLHHVPLLPGLLTGPASVSLSTVAELSEGRPRYCRQIAKRTLSNDLDLDLAENYTGAVVLDSEDTDVYVQAAYVSQQLQGDLIIKRKHAIINCKSLLSHEVGHIIIPLHIITGSDHTSGFYGHGKKQVLQKLITDPQTRKLLARVGESLELEEEVRSDMKAFVLSKVYAENADTCGQARASKWHKLKKMSTIRLPPDDDSLNHHLQSTNYITYC